MRNMEVVPEQPRLHFVYDLSGVRADYDLVLPVNLMPTHDHPLPEIYHQIAQHLGAAVEDMRFAFYVEDTEHVQQLAERIQGRKSVVLFHPDQVGVRHAASLRKELALGLEAGPSEPATMEVDEEWPLPPLPTSGFGCDYADSSDDLPSSSLSDMEADAFIDRHPMSPVASTAFGGYHDTPPAHLWTSWADPTPWADPWVNPT